MPKAVTLQVDGGNPSLRLERGSAISWSLFLQLTVISAVFLPFTKALTLPIGFPLKGYEVFLPLAVLFFFLSGKITADKNLKHLLTIAMLFWVSALFSTLINLLGSGADLSLHYRGGRFADGLMRSAYLLFNIMTFIVTYHAAAIAPRAIVNAWFMGLLIAFSYHFFTVFLFLLTGDAPLLPGLERHQTGWVGGTLIPRSGTFEEGNFAGLFYLLSLALAIYANNKIITLVSLAGILLSLSTSAYLAGAAFAAIYLFNSKGISFFNLFRLLIIIVAIIGVFYQLDFSQKFSEGVGASGAIRQNEALTGIQIFLANPILGVGLGGYGFYFDTFQWNETLSITAESNRRIANNIYAEILSETGSFGFSLFVLFVLFYSKCISNGGRNSKIFHAIGAAILVVFLAYPTFNITYLWFFMGLTIGLLKDKSLRPIS